MWAILKNSSVNRGISDVSIPSSVSKLTLSEFVLEELFIGAAGAGRLGLRTLMPHSLLHRWEKLGQHQDLTVQSYR